MESHPSALDPADFILVHGPDAYRRLLDRAPDGVSWLVRRAYQQFDVRSAHGKEAALEYLLNHLHGIQDYHSRRIVAEGMVASVNNPQGRGAVLKAALLLLATAPEPRADAALPTHKKWGAEAPYSLNPRLTATLRPRSPRDRTPATAARSSGSSKPPSS